MKKALLSTKARIVILLALIVTALAETLFRAIALEQAALSTANAGEQITVIIFAALILFFTANGNDKLSYISCGALIAYFVMDQLFEFPGMIGNLVANISDPAITISIVIRLLTMVGIVAISVLLAEYVNDGSIYNRAFSIIFAITALLLAVDILMNLTGLIFAPSESITDTLLKKQLALVIFNNVHRLIMLILFTTFAFDSAKRQLKREELTK